MIHVAIMTIITVTTITMTIFTYYSIMGMMLIGLKPGLRQQGQAQAQEPDQVCIQEGL